LVTIVTCKKVHNQNWHSCSIQSNRNFKTVQFVASHLVKPRNVLLVVFIALISITFKWSWIIIYIFKAVCAYIYS